MFVSVATLHMGQSDAKYYHIIVADTDDYARVALPTTAAPSAASAAAVAEEGNGLSEDSNNESCSDMESVIESEQGGTQFNRKMMLASILAQKITQVLA